jgi:tRNA(fMet)-specific endonuclease VapC
VRLARLLLDTSAYSALARGHEAIVERVRSADEVHVNPVVLGELLAGFARGGRRRKNEAELRRFLDAPRTVLDPIDADTALRYSGILNALRSAGTVIPTNDIWIAASVWQHGLALVTTDGHYLRVPQILVEHHAFD